MTLTAPRILAAATMLATVVAAPAAAAPQSGGHRSVSGVQSVRAPASAAMVCGGRRLYDVRQGSAVRVRLRLGHDVAVLKGRAGHSDFHLSPARLRHGRVVVRLHGRTVQTYRVHAVPDTQGPGALLSEGISAPHYRSVFCLAHLAGASTSVAALTTTSGFNQCCLDLSVFSGTSSDRAVRQAGTAQAWLATHGDGVVVRSANPSFTAAFTDYADTALPLQIFTLQDGRLVDASQSFPTAMHRDARHWWRQFVHPRNGPRDGLGALAAWVADKYVLRQGGSAWARVQHLQRAGRLRGLNGWPHGAAYARKLRAFLIRTGYAS